MSRKMNLPKIVLSEMDFAQISSYLDKLTRGISRRALADEVDRAEIKPAREVTSDTVRLNSLVRFLDRHSGSVREVRIVPPEQADAKGGKVSFLAPVGAALLGLRTGQEIDWPMPVGKVRSFRVLAVGTRELVSLIFCRADIATSCLLVSYQQPVWLLEDA